MKSISIMILNPPNAILRIEFLLSKSLTGGEEEEKGGGAREWGI